MESHTRIFWLFLAALLPSQCLLCQPAAHTALQLWFYIPVRQNYSLVHNVSQIRRSQFLVWTQTVGGYGFQREGVSCFDEMIQGLFWWASTFTGVAEHRNGQCCHKQCNFTVPIMTMNLLWNNWSEVHQCLWQIAKWIISLYQFFFHFNWINCQCVHVTWHEEKNIGHICRYT